MGAGGSQPVVTYEEAVRRLPEEWLEAVRLSFQEMSKHSKDLSGKITKDQFREFYGHKVLHLLGPIFDRLFEVLDQDGDGSVDFKEFMSGMFIFGRGSREEKLKCALFHLYDLNGDGLLSREEFDTMLRSSLKATQAAMGALLLREKGEYNDLVAAVRRNLKDSGPRITYIIDSIFHETDLNKDGYLSFDEFEQWAAGKGKDDLNIDKWMDSLLPQRMEQLKLAEESLPIKKEEATIIAEDIRLDTKTARFVQIEKDGRTVKYTGSGVDLHASSGYQTGLVHPSEMADTELSLFYFEFTVTDAGLTEGIAIGFYPADSALSGAPGWYHNSYGYHADEGCRYHQMKKELFKDGSRWTERKWGTGDTVGAGIVNNTIFFTRNGKRLEPAYENVRGIFYPVICFTSPGALGVCNFGEKPFKFEPGSPQGQGASPLHISVIKPCQ